MAKRVYFSLYKPIGAIYESGLFDDNKYESVLGI